MLDDATRQTLGEHLVDDGARPASGSGPPWSATPRTRACPSAVAASCTAGRRGSSLDHARPDEVADRLALHHLRAQEYEPAWHFARMAGESTRTAPRRTRRRRSSTSTRSPPHPSSPCSIATMWSTSGTRLGDVRVAAGVFDGGLQAYTSASKLSDDDPLTDAELLLRRAHAQERAGRYSDALRTSTRIRSLTENVDGAEALRARALAFRCVVRMAQERFSDIVRIAPAAVAAAEACGEKAGLARALLSLAWPTGCSADPMSSQLTVRSLSTRSLVTSRARGSRTAISAARSSSAASGMRRSTTTTVRRRRSRRWATPCGLP